MRKFQIFLILAFLLLYPFEFILQAQNEKFECGDILIDERDGQEYLTVKIGNQCWMAENLNFGKMVIDFQQSDNEIVEKCCYDNKPENCAVYGGLYTWNEAMSWENEPGRQGVCPEGWHLPTNKEWLEMNEFLGLDTAGTRLKVSADHEPGWDGSNSSGFSALPSGCGHRQYFGRLGYWAIFWTSTPYNARYAWFTQLDGHWALYKYTNLYQGHYYLKENGFSVRCVKDK